MAQENSPETLFSTARALEDVGDFTTAIALFREYLAADPADHCGAALRLARYGLAEPDGAPLAYVATLFNQNAEAFDHILVETLGYDVPALMRAMVEPVMGQVPRLLDLGCGTGLVGAHFNDMSAETVGVDVSDKMLEMADARRVYDDLYLGDVVRFLAEWDEAPFDLITAADVLPYLGNLAPFAAGAAACLTAGGLLCVSTERGEDGWGASGVQRLQHATSYVKQTFADAGLEVVATEAIVVRLEEGEPIEGDLILARKL